MPRKSKSTISQSKKEEETQGKYWVHPDAEWGGFINVRLQDDAKSEFQHWLEVNNDSIYMVMDDLMGEGMKISLSWDKLNGCAIVTFTGAIDDDHMTRYIMTTRGATWFEALALSVWKHFVYLEADWGNYKPRTSQSSVWG